jgi:predicted RNA polymerase sigma factor
LFTKFSARLLKRMSDSPMGDLEPRDSRGDGSWPKTGLDLLDGLKEDPRQANHHRLDAVRCHLLEMAGESLAAAHHYRAAAGKTANLPERNYLLMQAARLTTLPTDSG